MSRTVAVIGAPSSAGAYAPGQEEAPTALREAGLLGLLESEPGGGFQVRDAGDLPGFRWRPDRAERSAQNLAEVAANAVRVRDAVAPMLRSGAFALVLGGDCTVGVGTVAASVLAGGETGVVYMDMHADLNVPASVPDGALDWMGVAHMLAVDGARPELRDVGPRTPLIDAASIVVLGHEDGQATDWERKTIRRLGVTCVPAEALRADPASAAAAAIAALPRECTRIVVHFDVDVVDFVDAPLSENTGRNIGVPLDAAFGALTAITADGRTQALTLSELNPHHASADPEALARLCAGLAGALGRRAR
ncbi:MAG TPA: arginase family protein [Gaiellales bacterium]